MTARVLVEGDATLGRFPGLSDGAHSCRRSRRVRRDAPAGEVEQVGGSRPSVSLRRLSAPLSAGHDGQHFHPAEQRRAACFDRADHGVVGLVELVAQPVDVKLIDARQSPELLVGREVHAEKGMAGEHAPAVAVAVDRRLARAAEKIGRGDLARPVAVETHDEIGYLAARLDEMRAALQSRDERMQMMLAGIAHEVRNPLGGLEIYAGLLREGLTDQPERLEEVSRIEREIGYLKNVVSDFLEFARRPSPVMESFPVGSLLDEVCEIGRPVGPGPRLRTEFAPDLVAEGDRGQLRRAVLNLARNAIAAAGTEGEVVLAARRIGDEIEWEVRDSGPGVPPEIAEKVFTPFFTTREKGTGLGLAFVREIVRDHGGSVSLDRAPEGGACFRFTTRARPAP